jgi:hypothetical protein
MGGSVLGRLWSPPPGPVATLPPASGGATGPSWPTGRYVITIQGAGGGYDRWFGVEVILDGPD